MFSILLSVPLTFHAIGRWAEGQVRVTWTQDSRPRVPEIEDAIEKAWQEVLARPDVNLFDGPMSRMESWRATEETLFLSFSPTSYKPFLGTNLCNPHFADTHGPAALANPAGASVALESSDGYLMMGRRTATVAYYPSRVHPFAGALEPRDGADVFTTVRRELAEEVGFGPSDIADVRCLGIVEDRALRQPELIFHVCSTLGRSAIEAKMDREEHHATYAIRAKQKPIEAALADESLTPVARASLLLWGRTTFGPTWFDVHR